MCSCCLCFAQTRSIWFVGNRLLLFALESLLQAGERRKSHAQCVETYQGRGHIMGHGREGGGKGDGRRFRCHC